MSVTLVAGDNQNPCCPTSFDISHDSYFRRRYLTSTLEGEMKVKLLKNRQKKLKVKKTTPLSLRALSIVDEWKRGLNDKAIVLMIDNPKAYEELVLEAAKLETIRQAITKPQTVDVESLKRETYHIDRDDIGTSKQVIKINRRNRAWNACLDHLAENYHLVKKGE